MITKDMLISDLLTVDDGIAVVLTSKGMACCAHCDRAKEETLESACASCSIDADRINTALNKLLSSKGTKEKKASKVSKNMLISDIIALDERADAILKKEGLGGIHCAKKHGLSLSRRYGSDADRIVDAIEYYLDHKVSKDMLVADAVTKDDCVGVILSSRGMSCTDCEFAKRETLEQAFATYKIDADTTIREINECILKKTEG